MFFTNRFYSFDFAYKRELYFLITVLIAAVIGLSLYSYNVHDPSWFHYFSDPHQTENLCGMFGANIASVLNMTKDEAGFLKDVIIDLGLDPQLRVTTFEAAEAMELLAKNGIFAGLSMEEMKTTAQGVGKAVVLLSCFVKLR